MHFCVPKDLVKLKFDAKSDIIAYLNTKDVFHKVLSDLIASWKQMILLVLLSIGSRRSHPSIALYFVCFA